jgi:hypothetical protein
VSDPSGTPEIQACPRCGMHSEDAAWCPRCGLNVRRVPATDEPEVPLQPGDAPPLPGLLWDREPGQPHPALKAGVVTLAAVVVLAVALAVTSGEGSPRQASFGAFPGATTETTPTIPETPTTPEATTTPESTETTPTTPEAETTPTESTSPETTVPSG